MINMAEKSGRKRRRIEVDSDARKSYFEEILCNCARRYGYQSLKPEQKSAVIAFMEGNDVFITLPTGFGRSLCYFCLPSVFDALKDSTAWSVVLVVSPLMSLMNDQVQSLRAKGLTAVMCSGNTECKSVRSSITEGKFQIVFVTLEILFDKNWTDVFRSPTLTERLVAFVVDEVHCVKKW